MENAALSFERLLELSKKINANALDKVLFCIYRGATTPYELMNKLDVSKGNLANYCKRLITQNKIRKQIIAGGSRRIAYQITEKGTNSVEKFLAHIEKIKI